MPFIGTLRSFQVPAVDRIISEGRLLVAFEMGLGKTVVTIAALEEMLDAGIVEAGLVVVPASLKGQWKEQIEDFTAGKAWVKVIDGTPQRRVRQYKQARTGEWEYIILGYNQLIDDWHWVRQLPLDYVVLDEATAIKGFTSQRTKRVKEMQPRVRIGLTGQPVENRAEEAFSIMEWVDDSVLGTPATFERTFIKRDSYGRVKFYKNLPTLHRRLQLAMERKTWDDVPEDEKPRIVQPPTLTAQFDKAGAKLYRTIVAELLADLYEAQGAGMSFDVTRHYSSEQHASGAQLALRGRIMAKIMCLRMLCNHPHLLTISADRYGRVKAGEGGVTGGSIYAHQLQQRGLLDNLTKTPKLDELVAQAREILSANERNKLVVFNYFVPTLGLAESVLTEKHGIECVQFTGEMNTRQKDAARHRFQQDPSCRVFLSSDAGGKGVDLPQANYLINFDLPWSAGQLAQRKYRIVRLSTEWNSVVLQLLIMEGSIEEWQYSKVGVKNQLGAAMIDGKGIDAEGKLHVDLETLTEFLQSSMV